MYMNKHNFFLLNEFKSFTLDFYILQRVQQNISPNRALIFDGGQCRVIRKKVENETGMEGEASLS